MTRTGGRPCGVYGHYKPRQNRGVGCLDNHLGALAQRLLLLIEDRARRHRRIRPDRRSDEDGKTLLFANGRMVCEAALNDDCAARLARDPRLNVIGIYSAGISWVYLLEDLESARDVGKI